MAAEVTHRTDRRTEEQREANRHFARFIRKKKPKGEADSHEHQVQRGTYSRTVFRLPVGATHIPVSLKDLLHSQQPANQSLASRRHGSVVPKVIYVCRDDTTRRRSLSKRFHLKLSAKWKSICVSP